MLQFIAQDQQIRKKVFFKPQLSSQIKITPTISPQFINDTTLLYMSAFDFISYDTDQQNFTLIHRPLPPQNQSINYEEQFINANFGRDGKQRINQIFYLVKTTQNQEQIYSLGRRINSVNHQYDKKVIAKNKKEKKKKYTISDLDNKGNTKSRIPKNVSFEQQIPSGVLQFQKQFIVKQSISLIIFVVKKEYKQPQIKLSVTKIPEEKQEQDKDDDELSNPSPPSTQKLIQKSKKQNKKVKQFKNYLLIHSYSHNQTMTFELDESIQSAFQVAEGSPNIICVTEKYSYIVNFQIKNTYSGFNTDSVNYQDDCSEKDTYHNPKKGYLNSDIKVEVLDKFQLEFQMKTEGHIAKNLMMLSNTRNTNKNNQTKNGLKKNRRYLSVINSSVLKDRRVSSLLNKNQRKSENEKVCNNHEYSELLAIPKLIKNNTIEEQEEDDTSQTIKIIKKAFKVLPISFHQEEYVMIIYVISKVLCSSDTLQTLSFHYQTTILSLQSSQFIEVDFSEVISNNNGETFMNNTSNSYANRFGQELNTHEVNGVFQCIKQLAGVTSHQGVILMWEKNQPIVHQIIFKIDYRTSEMLDLSEPKNLKTQKSIFSSISYILQYRNKITLHLNSNVIKQIIISPNCQNFFILTGRNHNNNPNYRESQLEYVDQKPDDIQDRYDIDDYLIFQYDLFSELWSSDANVYLKNVPLSYHKRKVQQIAPFRMKNQILALTGKRVHEVHKPLLDGILYFDLHPYGYFIAVSFGFNAKIYSLQHSTLNLIYTYNAQNIKKIKYSPNGSDLVVMSQKSIKILDSYSFSIKYILQQKSPQCSFTNFGYSYSGFHLYTVYDYNFVNIHEGQSYSKINSIKPGQSSLLTIHDKILAIIPESEEKFCLVLLENGKLYFRWNQDVIAIQHEKIYEYEDQKLIKALHYDSKRNVLFCGLSNGCVRAHIWPIKNEASYNFDTYSEFKFSYQQITALNTSYLTNTLYVGDQNGNLTTVKFLIQKEKKITGQARPNNYFIFSSHSPLINMPKTQLQALQKCYKYVLSSNTTSMTQPPEKLKLQYKLNQIITRMNEQMKKFKKVMREKLIQKQSLAKNKLNFNKLYNQTKCKLSQVTHILKQLKQKQAEQRIVLNNEYESKLKKIIQTQNQLVKQKGLQLSKNFLGKAFLKQYQQSQFSKLKQDQKKAESQYSQHGINGINGVSGINGIKLMIREEELVPYEETDYLPNWKIDVKKQYIQKLNQELIKEQEKNYELKQTCTYMENSKNNLQLGRIKEQTVVFRINLELQEMNSKLQYHQNVHQGLALQLKQAEQKINRTQEQVVQRNPQFTRVASNQSNDDGCSYKLWVKDRMTQEVQMLYNHFKNLGDIMQQKQGDIIEMVSYKKKFQESIQSLSIKKHKMKEYLYELKDHFKSISNKLNQVKFSSNKHEFIQQRREQIKQRQKYIQKMNEKEKFFQETKHYNIANLDLFTNKLKSKQSNKKAKNLTCRLTSKDQDTIIKQKKQGHKILLQNSANRKIFQQKLLQQQIKAEQKTNLTDRRQIPKQIKKKINNIIEQIDLKVNNEVNELEYQKLNIVAPFKSLSNKCLSKRVKKLKSQKKLGTQINSHQFTIKLLQKLKQKQDLQKQNPLSHQSQNAHLNSVCQIKASKIQRIVPFSATSSPIIKQISSQFNLYQKSSKFLKNNVKIQQRKIKRLNGEKSQLLSQYQLLKYQNKQLSDDKAIIKDGIVMITEMLASKKKQSGFKIDSNKNVQTIRKTPFQNYVQQRSCKMSPNKTLNNFREFLENSRIKKPITSSRTSRIKLNATAFATPMQNESPNKIQRFQRFSARKN